MLSEKLSKNDENIIGCIVIACHTMDLFIRFYVQSAYISVECSQ